MNFYFELADKFISNFPDKDEFEDNKDFKRIIINKEFNLGFEYQNNYSGRMAETPKTGPSAGKIPKKTPRKGLFDIVITSGELFEGKIAHRDCFEMIIQNNLINDAKRVWIGEDPKVVGKNKESIGILTVLSLLMFEQEINWGTQEWQKASNFSPKITDSKFRRPRDMIMGYILQANEKGIENVKWWQKISGNKTPTFTPPVDIKEKILNEQRAKLGKERLIWTYDFYPDEHKKYFKLLENTPNAHALMTNFHYNNEKMVGKFRSLAKKYPINPILR